MHLADQHAHDATHDPLTDLPNRRHLHQHLAELLDQRPPHGCTAAMLIDLDHFKQVNDTLGHPVWDRVLTEFAHRLRASVGTALPARLGGDGFAVILHEPTPVTVVLRAEQILAGLRGQLDLDGVPVAMDASAGLAIAAEHTTAAEMLKRADVALYQAKGLTQPIRLAVYHRTRTAHPGTVLPPFAQVRHTGWTLLFQPIVDLATGQIVAAEAITWQPAPRPGHQPDHPDHDLDPPPPARLLGMLTRSGPAALNRFVDRMINIALRPPSNGTAPASTWVWPSTSPLAASPAPSSPPTYTPNSIVTGWHPST